MKELGTAFQNLMPERRHLLPDVIAGLTFAIVNVPQAMGHALLATVNPVLGIYTLMLAAPVAALSTSSVFMNVSTTAALSVAAGADLAGVPESERGEALAVLVLLVGGIQLAAGLFRLGFLIRFVSNAVMTGFLNGVAALIVLGQLGHLTGFDSAYANQAARAWDLLVNLGHVNVEASIIGLATLGAIVLLLATRLRKFAFIVAIAASTALLAFLTLPGTLPAWGFGAVRTVGDLGAIPREWPELTIPSPALVLTTLLPALSVAIVGLIQGAGVSQSAPNPDGKYPDVSRDFLGQGLANIAAGFIGGIPAGGSISGTVLVVSAGAKSRWSNIFAGLFVALIVLAAAPLVEMAPMPALAALLIVAGFQGLRVEAALDVWRAGKLHAAAMIATVAATLIVPLQDAVLIGMALSILLHVFHEANQVAITQIVPVRGGLPEERPAPEVLPSNELTILQVNGSLFFAGAKYLEQKLPKPDQVSGAVVAIGLRGQTLAGSTFMSVLRRYATALHARDSRLMLFGVEPALGDQLARTGVLALIGEDSVFAATPQLGGAMNEAIAEAHAWLGRQPGDPRLGT